MQDGIPPRTVTHPSTNRTRRGVTWLARTSIATWSGVERPGLITITGASVVIVVITLLLRRQNHRPEEASGHVNGRLGMGPSYDLLNVYTHTANSKMQMVLSNDGRIILDDGQQPIVTSARRGFVKVHSSDHP